MRRAIYLFFLFQTGNAMIGCLGDKVETFLGYTDVGSQFVYGYLAMDIIDAEGQFVAASVFYFKTLSVIFFFSFMVSMLFYAGIMQWVIMKMGWMLSVTLGTTAAESLSAAANVFLGQVCRSF